MSKLNPTWQVASEKQLLPVLPPAKKDGQTMLVAQNSPIQHGVVLDYVTKSGSLTGYTFQGDTTYFINGYLTLNGANTF